MNILPNSIVILDKKLELLEKIPRLDTAGEIDGHKLTEGDYDKLIVAHSDTVADALREAEIFAQDSELLLLGRQVLSIDVLFAEVSKQDRTFRRFVVIEDKLFRNAEARREVLGQILEYAKVLRETDLERFRGLLPIEHREWLDGNDELVEQALRHGDFLLLVCGDRIQSRLIGYVEHLKEMLDPLIAADVALMSFGVFSNSKLHILIPYVVALVTAEQGTTIKVVVQDSRGTHLPASVSVTGETSTVKKRGDKMELEGLMEAIRKNCGRTGEKSVAVAETLLKYAEQHGAEVEPKEASASVRVKDVNSKNRSTLFVVTKHGTFYIGWHDRWPSIAGADPSLGANYKERLTRILGRSPEVGGWAVHGGKTAVPLTIIGEHLQEVLNEIGLAIKGLRHD